MRRIIFLLPLLLLWGCVQQSSQQDVFQTFKSHLLTPFSHPSVTFYITSSQPPNVTVIHTPSITVINASYLTYQLIFFAPNGSVNTVCMLFNGTTTCSNHSKLLNKFYTLDPFYNINKSLKEMNVLYKKGGLTVVKNGTCFTLHYNYDVLSLDDIKSIGLSPNDPKFTFFSNFTQVFCFNNNSEDVFLSYNYNGKLMNYSSHLSFSFTTPPLPHLQPSNTTMPVFTALTVEKRLKQCLSNHSDSCVLTLAYDYLMPSLCDYTNKVKCITVLAQTTGNVSLCDLIDKETCIADVAVATQNKTLCSLISNTTLKQQCLSST